MTSFATNKLRVGYPVRISLDRDGNAAYASYYGKVYLTVDGKTYTFNLDDTN